MSPTVGRIVHYRVSDFDVERIREQHLQGGWANNALHAGDTVAMVIVRVWTPFSVNGRLMLDAEGPAWWVASVARGKDPGQWDWPERV